MNFKKVISGILALSVALTLGVPCGVSAMTTDTAGETTLNVDLGNYSEVLNGQYSNSVFKLSDGGKAVYDLYIPFNAASVEIKFTPKNGESNLTLMMNDKTYTKVLSGSSASITLDPCLHKGQYQMIIKSDKAVDIYSVQIRRAKMLGTDMYLGISDSKIGHYDVMPDLTDYEKAVQTAIIASANSPVIMVNGGRRYVNNDDPRETPYIENGEIYLPMHTFSRAFEYYYEQKEDEWVITKDAYTFRFKNGVLTKQNYSSKPYEIENITRTVGGRVYFPLRYFADIEGKVLKQRDGIYVVEYKSNADTILSDKYFSELSSNYNEWRLEEKKGTTYYVSQECDSCDTNDGSYEKPFKTIAKAAEVAKEGDTVIIRGGTYYEELAPKNNGTASNPVTFKAAEGETVKLTATAELGEPVGTKINAYGQEMLVYNALTDLGYGRNQIFYKQKNLLAGIHPNENTNDNMNLRPEGLDPVWGVQGNIKVSPANNSILTSATDLDQEAGFWNGATVIAYTGAAWSLGTAIVEKSEPGQLTVTDKCKQWWFSANKGHTTNYAWITNHINTVDKPGEWAFEDGKIYILPPEGETAETLKLEQKVRQVMIDLTDSKYVRVEGIDTYGGGIKMNNSVMCMLRDGTYEYISHYSYSQDQRDGYIDAWDKYNPDGAPPRGEMGIYVGGKDNVILNNTIQYSAGAGIYSVGCYEYIENNALLDCGYMASYVGGLFIGTQAWDEPDTPRGGNAIYSNTLMRSGRHCYGYSTNESWYGAGEIANEADRYHPAFLPSEFAYNDIKDGSVHARDTAPWYQYGTIAGTERLKTRDHHNTVANSWANDGTMNAVVYYDGMASMFQFYNNIMYWDNGVNYDTSLYRQDLESSQAVVDVWNNADLGYVEGGKDAIEKSQYPNEKMFATGASQFLKDKTPYLNTCDEENSFITLDGDVEISSGASVEEGLFKPSADGDWICFKNVDFSGNKNKISIYYSGDYCNTGDAVSVIIGNSLTDYKIKESAVVYTKTPETDVVDINVVRFVGAPEKANVYIQIDDYKSINIEKISLDRVDDDMARVAKGIYADMGAVVSGEAGITVIPEGEIHYIINKTQNAIVEFKGVELASDANELFVRMCGSGANAGQPVELRIGSPDGELYGTFVSEHDSWYDYNLEYAKLDKTLKAGTYDIYLSFKGSQTSNFLWFGLGYNDEYTK